MDDDASYERFDTNDGFQAALERLLGQPGRELRIFDPDGSALRLNEPGRIEKLEAFLQQSRTRRMSARRCRSSISEASRRSRRRWSVP